MTDPGTDESRKASKPEKRMESTERTHNSYQQPHQLSSKRAICKTGGGGGRRERKGTNAKRDRYQIEPVVGPQRCCSCGVC